MKYLIILILLSGSITAQNYSKQTIGNQTTYSDGYNTITIYDNSIPEYTIDEWKNFNRKLFNNSSEPTHYRLNDYYVPNRTQIPQSNGVYRQNGIIMKGNIVQDVIR